MTDIQWVKLTTCGTGLDLDIVRGTLEDAGIPARIEGGLTGGFGPGYQGLLPGGASVYVPSVDQAEASSLLGLDDAEPD